VSQSVALLSITQLNRLFEVSFVWDESSVSNTSVTVIPSLHRVTQQVLSHRQPFLDLKLMFAVSHRVEQLRLCSQQRVVVNVEDSVQTESKSDGPYPGTSHIAILIVLLTL
jgi:hypothetical protein